MVRQYIFELVEHLMSLFSREDRQVVFNDLAKSFNIKVDVVNRKPAHKPMHIEMVKDNFNSIVSALKMYQNKQ